MKKPAMKVMDRVQAWPCQCGRPECTGTLIGMGTKAEIKAVVVLEPDQAAELAAQIIRAVPVAGHG